MKYSIVFTATLAAFAAAVPAKRDGPTDVDILNFALTLEHLENAFYVQGLGKYSEADFVNAGLPEWARGRFEQIAAHEGTHVDFLTSAIQAADAEAVQACTYKFPDTDAKSFVDVAAALENVGTSAYSGAAAYIKNKDYLTAAATILSTEGRHSAWIDSAVRKEEPWSSAFETPLDLNQVYTMASAFITSCPSSNPVLPVKAFTSLTFPATASPGAEVELTFDGTARYVAFLTGTGTIYAELRGKKVTIPSEILGRFYAIATNEKSTEDASTVAGPAMLLFAFDSEGKFEML